MISFKLCLLIVTVRLDSLVSFWMTLPLIQGHSSMRQSKPLWWSIMYCKGMAVKVIRNYDKSWLFEHPLVLFSSEFFTKFPVWLLFVLITTIFTVLLMCYLLIHSDFHNFADVFSGVWIPDCDSGCCGHPLPYSGDVVSVQDQVSGAVLFSVGDCSW